MKKLISFLLAGILIMLSSFSYVSALTPLEYPDDESVEKMELNAAFIENRLQLSWAQPTEYELEFYLLLKQTDDSTPTKYFGDAKIVMDSYLDQETAGRGSYIDDELAPGVSYYRLCSYINYPKRGCGNVIAVYGKDKIVLSPNVDSFPDVEGHWGEQHIEKLRVLNVVEGRDGMFEPNSNILRAEAIKIMMLAFRIGGTSCQPSWFPDMSAEDWFCDVVSKAAQQGYVQGDDGQLFPGREITRAEAVKIVLLIKGVNVPEVDEDPFNDVDHTLWYAKYIAKAKELGIVQGVGDNDFDPNRSITRAELSKIAVEAAEL